MRTLFPPRKMMEMHGFPTFGHFFAHWKCKCSMFSNVPGADFPGFPVFSALAIRKNLLQVAFLNLFHGPKVQKHKDLKLFCVFIVAGEGNHDFGSHKLATWAS